MILEFDNNDYESVCEAISKLHKIRLSLEKKTPGFLLNNKRFEKRLESFKKEFDLARLIYATDISAIYDCGGDSTFYVYAHCNPLKPLNIKKNSKHAFAAIELNLKFEPFYLGKGQGDRCFDLNRNEGHRKIRQMITENASSIEVVKISENLTEAEAFSLESKLIDIFGLKSLDSFNLLVNLDEGKKADLRRSLYPKGCNWYLNKNKMRIYNSVPKG